MPFSWEGLDGDEERCYNKSAFPIGEKQWRRKQAQAENRRNITKRTEDIISENGKYKIIVEEV